MDKPIEAGDTGENYHPSPNTQLESQEDKKILTLFLFYGGLQINDWLRLTLLIDQYFNM